MACVDTETSLPLTEGVPPAAMVLEPEASGEPVHPAPEREESARPPKVLRGAEEQELINCTPHEVNYYREDGNSIALPSAMSLRAGLSRLPDKGSIRLAGEWFDIYDDPDPVLKEEDVPCLEALAGKAIVVSRPMAMAIKSSGRRFGIRVLTPNSEGGQAVRDENKQICGVRSFIDWGTL